ncbi:MAG: hypothetical protein JXP73_21860 [Deltaproteobacteria bacterium]|nr:hypothetical protein [Deltaproteobacteria bacterium]
MGGLATCRRPWPVACAAADATFFAECAPRVYHRSTMASKKLFVVVAVAVGSVAFAAGCGGIGDCPGGNCGMECAAGTFASGRACVPFTVCPAGSYVAQAGTPTSDQACGSCASGTFSDAQNSAACSAWQTCGPGYYVLSQPSATADRVCALCGAGTYTSGENQSSCLGVSECPAGTMETKAGTPSAPPVCTPCRPGEYCAGGTATALSCVGDEWDDDGDPATECVSKTACSAGFSVTSVGSATADRTCAPCAGGSYSPTQNAAACAAWSDCPPGTYVAIVPSLTSDRVCAPCPAGKYTSVKNQVACLAADECPAGTVQVSPGTATEPPTCGACSPGEYCQGGSVPALACPEQSWDHDSDPATQCIPWSFCLPGQYVALPGSATLDQWCFPCSPGTFTATANRPACTPWTDCWPGTYVTSAPTAQTDRGCGECSPGSFTTASNESSCTAWSTCLANTEYVSTPGTSTSDVACSACSLKGCAHYCTESGSCFDCVSYQDCAAGLSCVDGFCEDLGCGGNAYFSESFSSGNANWWVMDGAWEIGWAGEWAGDSPGLGNEDPTSDHSADDQNQMAGVAIGGLAPAGAMAEMSYFTSPIIDISQGPTPVYLEFYRWLNTDKQPNMNNAVEVFDGGRWVPLWSGPQAEESAITERGWSRQWFDVTPFRNRLFMVRFGYQILDAEAPAVGSWNIDDVRVANTLTCQ